jgi:hypothetical protein
MVWFPPLDGAALSASFFSYAGQLYMTIVADKAILPDPDFLTTSFVTQIGQLSKLLSNRRLPGEHTAALRHHQQHRSSGLHTTPLHSNIDSDINIHEVQARIFEVQKQLQELESSLEMDTDQELTEDEARLVEQLEALKVEFGGMLYELRHKLNVHVTTHNHTDDDDYDDDGDLRPQYRRLSLHSAAVSSRGLLSAVSARILHVPAAVPNSPPPPSTLTPTQQLQRAPAVSSSTHQRRLSSVESFFQRKYHSFHSNVVPRPSGSTIGSTRAARLSLDCALTVLPSTPTSIDH